jgi:hypothetical protein
MITATGLTKHYGRLAVVALPLVIGTARTLRRDIA